MKHTFSQARNLLTISADESERAELREMSDIQSDKATHEFFERLICNSELQWVNAEDTGDLTAAPMLAILGDPVTKDKIPQAIGVILAGHYGNPPQDHYHPIVERWAFMAYETQSVLEALRDNGAVVFTSGRDTTHIKTRLEYLRRELRAERISYWELCELQSYADYIPQDDTELRQAAGIPE